VVRGTALLALSRILDRASTFVILILVAPRFGAAGVGAYSAAMALYGLFTYAGEAGTTNYLVRELSRDRSRTATYVVHLSAMALAVSLVLLGGVEVLIPHLGYSTTLRESAAILVLAIPGTVLNSVQEGAFLAHRRVHYETIVTLVSSVAYIVLGAALLLSHHGIQALMWSYVALEYSSTVVYFLLISRRIARLRARFQFSLARRLAGEMKMFTASSLIQAVFIRPEIVLLSVLASATQVGYYGAAVRVAELPQFLPEVFMANVFTVLSASYPADEARFRAILTKALRAMLAFALVLTAIMFAAAPEIVRLLFGSRLHAAAPMLRILSASVLFSALIAVFWRALAARGRQDAVLRVQVAMIAIRIGGGAALIAPLAGLGAAVATSVSALVQLTLLAAAAGRSGVAAAILRPGWRLALAAVAAGAVTWIAARVGGIWLALPSGLIAYALSALALGAVSREERATLTRLRRPASAGRP
jgi:O-antigen/teichoic acid export membrane protein